MSKIEYCIGYTSVKYFSREDEIDLTEFLDFDIEDKYELQNAILDNLSKEDIIENSTPDVPDDTWWIDLPEIDNLDVCWEEYLMLKQQLEK